MATNATTDWKVLSITIASQTLDRLSCGVVVLDPVAVNHSPKIEELVTDLSTQLIEQHAGLLPSQIPGLTEARQLYKSFGMEPSRHRPSSEALLRRVLKGKGLYQINNLVDSCNYASLSFLLPIGMYDLNKISGDVRLQEGTEGDHYSGIRKGQVNVGGRLALYDDLGPFGSPTSDSARTCVDDQTEAVLAVIMATANYPATDMQLNIDVFSEVFVTCCGATESVRSLLNSPSK